MNADIEREQVKQERRESVKLDAIVKLLFSVSKPLLVNAINGLFNTTYDPDETDVDVIKTATEYAKKDMSLIRADLFIQVRADGKSVDYHLEFQLAADSRMVVRLFEYDIQHALENFRLSDISDVIKLKLAQSIVLHFEKSNTVPDTYRLLIEFADGTTHEYSADIFKYWNYDNNMLIDRKLYNLLPLQLFILRAELDKLTEGRSEQAKPEAAVRVINLTKDLVNRIMELYDNGEFDILDLDRITSALNELYGHLRDRYNISEELSKEAENMIKTLYDERLVAETKKQANIETAIKMLLKDKPIDEIIEFTELTKKEIQDIQKTLNKA